MGNSFCISIRDVSPCKGCTEKFMTCHDRCPKDARGEYGYGAWKAEIERVKDARKQHIKKALGKRYTNYGGVEDGK